MANDPVRHDYHLVEPSAWPFVGSLAAFVTAVGTIAYFQTLKGAPALFGVFSGPVVGVCLKLEPPSLSRSEIVSG